MYRIIIILALLIYGCTPEASRVNVTDPYVPPVVIPDEPDDPEIIAGGIKQVVFKDGNQVKFFDGSGVYVWRAGNSVSADNRKLTLEKVLYTMDGIGNIISQESLNIIPDFCVVDLDENVWTAKTIDPETAYNRGQLYTYYLDVYKNNVFFVTLKLNPVSMILSGSDVIVIDINGAYYDATGTKTGINSAMGFTVYDFDAVNRTAKINGVPVSWSTNSFNGAKQWNGAYSWNGYKWDGVTLTENGSYLKIWTNRSNYPINIPENAVVISAGQSVFSGETHYFFIECNSGWLFKYIPSSDTLVQITRLYTGDGYRDTGIYYSKILNPVCSYDRRII